MFLSPFAVRAAPFALLIHSTVVRSLWQATLAEFADGLAAKQPAPAGVAAAAVAGAFGASLFIKVLEIRRPDEQALARQLAIMRAAVADFHLAAEADIDAVQSRDRSRMMEAPVEVARTAVRTLGMIAGARGQIRGPLGADVTAAAMLVAGAGRAALACAIVNLKTSRPEPVPAEIAALGECAALAEAIDRLSGAWGRVPIVETD
jgi:formiminotetrahydrofolate cyclodeaminase